MDEMLHIIVLVPSQLKSFSAQHTCVSPYQVRSSSETFNIERVCLFVNLRLMDGLKQIWNWLVLIKMENLSLKIVDILQNYLEKKKTYSLLWMFEENGSLPARPSWFQPGKDISLSGRKINLGWNGRIILILKNKQEVLDIRGVELPSFGNMEICDTPGGNKDRSMEESITRCGGKGFGRID